MRQYRNSHSQYKKLLLGFKVRCICQAEKIYKSINHHNQVHMCEQLMTRKQPFFISTQALLNELLNHVKKLNPHLIFYYCYWYQVRIQIIAQIKFADII